ncbi:unnamed protein product [Parnassius mnemosyne]|uniref:Reverse transcriptase domain-containing protein n=1 Tax=Parnassius mnemosyne TaxID=213953 RepID=A0AAV1LQ35_9NEOP
MESEYDMIALTETFLTSSVSNGELFPPGFHVVRKDRTGDCGWGGVLLAIRDRYNVKIVTDIVSMTDDKELIFAIVTFKNVKVLCCVVYLPPNYKDEQYLNVLTCIENVICTYPDLNVLILGDFNLNSCSTNIKTSFDFFCEFCSLKQYNTVLNNRGGMLDLVLGSFEAKQIVVSLSEDPLVNIDQYHPMLDINITFPGFWIASNVSSLQQVTPRSNTNIDWNWRKADFQGLYRTLIEIDWSDLLTISDINCAVQLFYDKLYEIINLFVPIKKQLSNNQRYIYPNWYNVEIIKNIKNKHFHHKQFKKEGKEFNKAMFIYYREKVKKLIDCEYRKYMTVLQKNIIDDPVQFWKYVKEKKNNRSKLEYGAVIWNPYEEKYVLMIEKIQRKFARWIYKKQYGYYPYLYPSLFVSDLQKAFDCVSREMIWWALRSKLVPETYVEIVRDMYRNSDSIVRTAVGDTTLFSITVGVHQGSVLSPYLFSVILDELSASVQKLPQPWLLMYADNIALVDGDKGRLTRRVHAWREALENGGLKLNVAKTEYMACNSTDLMSLLIGDDTVERTDNFRYLGSVLDASGDIDRDIKARISAAWAKWREIEEPSHRKNSGTFLVPMNGGIWTMCVSLEEEEVTILSRVGFPTEPLCTNYLANNQDEEIRADWQHRMQNLSISCALVCLIVLGSAALVGAFGVCKHQISAVLVTGVMYLLAGLFAMFTLMIIHFKRMQRVSTRSSPHGDDTADGVVGPRAPALPLLSAREFTTSWSLELGWGGVALATTTSLLWILLSKIMRYNPITAMLL